ncbi:MAG TPA: glycerophosphodiester phosphodiesterase [Syntrophales bacterium]|nr:glycerophosphodiester phosphodiesterase [Syntrophales bacterium]
MTKQPYGKYRIPVDILIISTVLLFFTACQITEKNVDTLKPERLTKKFYVIGHRGAAGLAPENTLAAFKRALNLGIDAVELDILITADGKIVVHHDFNLKPEITRTSNGAWLKDWERPAIKDLTLAELRAYDVGRLKPDTKYARRYPEQQPADRERIPTLREVITLLKSYDTETQLWVEIKTSPEKPDMTPPPEAVADALVRLLREQNFAGRTRVLSFGWRALVHVQKIAPEIPTVYVSLEGQSLNNIKAGQPGASPWMAGLDIDDFNGSIPQAIKAAGGRYWAPYYKHVTYDLMNEAHKLGLQVFAWAPDERNTMVLLIEKGVDGIITNRPDILKSILRGNQG